MSFAETLYYSRPLTNSDIASGNSGFTKGRWKRSFFLTVSLMIMLVSGAPKAFADSILVHYTATNVGGAEWRYDYTLSGSYLSGYDMAVYFPVATSANLSDLQTGGTDWTTFVYQPDPNLPADGEFDIFANIDNPSVAPVFSVFFQWSGSGNPGTQSFTLYDSNFKVLDSGVTLSTVVPTPEPASLVLLGSAFVALWLIVRRRRPNDVEFSLGSSVR